MEIKDLDFAAHWMGSGQQAIVWFENGYGASIVTGPLFYSSPSSPYEIAVLNENGITYNTPITGDVCGYLTEDEANDVLAQIEALVA